jgi:multiple sugar transport system ATP-binding protein
LATIAIEGIRKTFGHTEVLRGIDLDIADGEFVSLVGPSGCGKSTLLRIIAGLEEQDSGSIRLGLDPVDHLRASDRDLAMVFQSYALYPHLTVAENIAVPLRMREMSGLQRMPLAGRFVPGAAPRRRAISDQVRRAAEMLDIDHLLDRKPGHLSGGQRQRVALGRALVRQPRAFLLDEPLSNLDAKLRVQTRAEIAELHRRLGATFVYVTHDQVEAMTMSDRIAVMMDGEILQCGSPGEIYDEPADVRVAEFIGSPKINLLPAEVEAGGGVTLFGHPVPLRAETRGPLHLALRPEALRRDDAGGAIRGTIAHLENLGPEVVAQLALDGHDERIIARFEARPGRSLQLGEAVGLSFERDRAQAFGADGKRVRVRPVSAHEVA